MGEIVNLRQMKKRRDRDAKATQAVQNRIRHGRTGARKASDREAEGRRNALLDAARVSPDNGPDEPAQDR